MIYSCLNIMFKRTTLIIQYNRIICPKQYTFAVQTIVTSSKCLNINK